MTAQYSIGKLITGDEGRDAVHIALAPTVAGERLYPGDHIGLLGGEAFRRGVTCLGVVDPFLTGPVYAGERFFMFLYPNTITSLRHVWTHPGFSDKEAPPAPDYRWIKQMADRMGITFDDLIQAATDFLDHETVMDEVMPFEFDTDFWGYYERCTGRIVPPEKQQRRFFSCAC